MSLMSKYFQFTNDLRNSFLPRYLGKIEKHNWKIPAAMEDLQKKHHKINLYIIKYLGYQDTFKTITRTSKSILLTKIRIKTLNY